MNKELIKKSEVTFEKFQRDFKGKKQSEESMKVIYLIAIENLTIREVAKIIGKSKQYVVDKVHRLNSLIYSVRMEYRLRELRKSGASKKDLFSSRAILLGAARKELERRAGDYKNLEKMPLNKLIDIIDQLSDALDIVVSHKTSFKESQIASLSLEKGLTIEEEA